ncbi:MAG: ornithine cyclodeaminase family protein [Saprospiraceae bacterium]
MTTIINKAEIQAIVNNLDVLAAMEKGFIDYSNGKTVVPPVGELLFEEAKGDAHIKYGYIKDDAFFVIKIATGFYNNSALGLPSSQGLMLVFSQKTGQPIAILLDEGMLTDIRTAAAGALAAQYFAPKTVKAIGIIGTGIQARLQLEYLWSVVDCDSVWVWGRNRAKAEQFKADMGSNFTINVAETAAEVAQHCNLIVTTTPAEVPLLWAKDIQSGTHITAVGSDTHKKQELDSALLQRADLVIADSLPQSQSRGEIFRATQAGAITAAKVVELGTAIQNPQLQRRNNDQISIVDLTGVAVQDIMIATAVYLKWRSQKS